MIISGKCNNGAKLSEQQIAENTNGRDGFVNTYVEKIKETFKLSPVYFPIYKVDGIEVTNQKYDAWLIDENSYKDEIGQKKISLYPEQKLFKGDIFNIPDWDNQKWMTTRIDPKNLYYDNGYVEKCNYILKWIDKQTYKIYQTYCVIENPQRMNKGITENQTIIVGDADFKITLPINEFTLRLSRDDRLLISMNSLRPIGYIISKIDDISNPDVLTVMVMENGGQVSSYDDTVNMIPDYYKYYNGSIAINITNPVDKIIIGNDYQLNVQVSSGAVAMQPLLEYMSSDNNVATIDENGKIHPIANGNTAITVRIKDMPNKFTTINLRVTDVIADNYSLLINGSSTLKNTQTLTYTINIYNNGVLDNTKSVVWAISDGSKAQIVSQNGTSIQLKGLSSSGTVTLRATIDGRTEYIEKIISMKSTF